MWKEENNSLTKTFKFSDFSESIAFVVKVALIAEKLDHHPKIIIDYNKVIVTTTTHSANHTITAKDIQLSAAINTIT